MKRPAAAAAFAGLFAGIWSLTTLQPADARPGFGGRMAHFNTGPHFNGPREFGQLQPRPRPPGPEPKPRPAPKPGPEPGPKPGPGPKPPGPGPHPPPPPVYPIHPGYWPPPYPWYNDPSWYGTAAAATALTVGTLVASIPADCRAVAVAGITYQLCGNTWYAPRFSGNQLVYVVVAPPT